MEITQGCLSTQGTKITEMVYPKGEGGEPSQSQRDFFTFLLG